MTKNAGIGLGGAAAGVVITVGRTALLTKTLAIEEVGYVVIVQSMYAFAGTFIGLRITDVMLRFFSEFEEREQFDCLRDLIAVCLLIAFATATVVAAVGYFSAGTIAIGVYDNPEFASGIRVFSMAAFFSMLGSFSLPILRIRDRFGLLTIWGIVGQGAAVAMLFVYLLVMGGTSTTVVLGILAAGTVLSTLPPFVTALLAVRGLLHGAGHLGDGFRQYAGHFWRVILNTNLVGYLKVLFPPGDVFFLGLCASPSEVAVYAVARQLLWPLTTLQNSLAAALGPEATLLGAREQWTRLRRVSSAYAAAVEGVAVLFLVALALIGKPIIQLVTTTSYEESWSIALVLAVALALFSLLAAAYPVGLVMDRVTWYNVSLALGVLGAIVVALAVGVDAMTMALIQCAAAAVVVVIFVAPTFVALDRRGRQHERAGV